MGTGWRRAFCTTAPRNSDATAPPLDSDKQNVGYSPSPSPRSCVKFAFLSGGSNPSTPRPVSRPSLRCRTADESPKLLQCKTATPRSATKPAVAAGGSNPSSPRSPLKLSLFRNSFKFRNSCGICLNSVKTGQGTAIYTAECSHAFHFPCIADYVRTHGKLVCPVCNAVWKDVSLLAAHQNYGNATAPPINGVVPKPEIQEKRVVESSPRAAAAKPTGAVGGSPRTAKPKPPSGSRFYDDDEPLLSPRFVPIPEADENAGEEDDDDVSQFKGFVVDPNPSFAAKSHHEVPIFNNGRDFGNVQVRLLPESAVVSVGCGYETHAVALRVKAPPPPAAVISGRNAAALLNPSHRAPVDLVAVLDVGGTVTFSKLQMMKRAMRLVVSSLGAADRLSVVAVSATANRLLPLKRMTEPGKRAARRVVDKLLCGQGSNLRDALRKATRVLEDRREKNPVASVMLLSDGQDSSRAHYQRSTAVHVGSNRFTHIEIPVHDYGFGESCGGSGCNREPAEEAFAKCVGGLLSVVVQDLRIQLRVGSGSAPCEISAVYLCNGRPTLVSSGSGSVRLGDLYADEERELLVELRVPTPPPPASGSHHVLSVRGLYKDPSTHEVVYGRDQSLRVPQAVRSSASSSSSTSQKIERLRSLFITTRAVAESRRLEEHGEFTSAHHLLASARALLLQSRSAYAEDYVKAVEFELAEVHWRRQQLIEHQQQQQQQTQTQVQRRRRSEREMMILMDENGDPLTPTSAWRAAEKLAKVAMMKKSIASDLHGFENARF